MTYVSNIRKLVFTGITKIEFKFIPLTDFINLRSNMSQSQSLIQNLKPFDHLYADICR